KLPAVRNGERRGDMVQTLKMITAALPICGQVPIVEIPRILLHEAARRLGADCSGDIKLALGNSLVRWETRDEMVPPPLLVQRIEPSLVSSVYRTGRTYTLNVGEVDPKHVYRYEPIRSLLAAPIRDISGDGPTVGVVSIYSPSETGSTNGNQETVQAIGDILGAIVPFLGGYREPWESMVSANRFLLVPGLIRTITNGVPVKRTGQRRLKRCIKKALDFI